MNNKVNSDNSFYANLLKEGLLQMGISPDNGIMDRYLLYMEMVLETNKTMNLTTITNPDDFIIKHFIDSLSICKGNIFQNSSSVIDVGTGAGFPGIPLAIAFPEKKFLLMDSLNKRIRFLENVKEELGLENITCCHARAEDLGNSARYRETYDLCVSRAVARLSVLSEYCLPLVKTGGFFAAYKTRNEDLSEGENAIKLLGGKIEMTQDFPSLSGILNFVELEHRLVYIKKIKNTPKNYPRKSGLPSKNPL